MAYADAVWMKPDGHQVMMGDSDDTDIRDLLAMAAYLLDDPVLRGLACEKMDFESIWDLGMEAAEFYNRMAITEPKFTSKALSDSGNYYLRSDWSDKADFLHFHCGTLGAGHGHSDKLHIDLVIRGEDVLMDAGRYTYVTGGDRFEFKDPTAHNTLTVDGKFFTVCKDNWECSKLSQPVRQQFVDKGAYAFIQGGHLGYMADEGVFVNRKIIHIKPGIYILVDECYTCETHSYNQYFHFNDRGRVCIDGQSVRYVGEQAEADFYFISPDITLKAIPSRVSRNYNQAQPNTCIETAYSGKGFRSAITVIHGGAAGQTDPVKIEKIPVKSALKKTTYPDSMAEAVKITLADTEYVITICHQEINSPTDLVEADGCMGFGNVIIFNKSKECLVGDVLNW